MPKRSRVRGCSGMAACAAGP